MPWHEAVITIYEGANNVTTSPVARPIISIILLSKTRLTYMQRLGPGAIPKEHHGQSIKQKYLYKKLNELLKPYYNILVYTQ